MTTTEEPIEDQLEDKLEDNIDEVAGRPDPDLKLEQGAKLSLKDKSALNALIRMHFKTLLDEITDEEQRALATVSTRVAARRREEAQQADGFKNRLQRIIDRANDQIEGLIAEHPELFSAGGNWQRPHRLNLPSVYQRNSSDAAAMQSALTAQIRSRATTARVNVRRRETENLRAVQLAVLDAKFLAAVKALPQRDEVFTTADILQLESAPEPDVEVVV